LGRLRRLRSLRFVVYLGRGSSWDFEKTRWWCSIVWF
jgi:hypothetical protein